MIKAVLFDVDGVLLDSFEANRKFLNDYRAMKGMVPLTADEFVAMKGFHLPFRETIRQTFGIETLEGALELIEHGREQGIVYATDLVGVPEGIHEALKSLQKKYILGIVSSRRAITVETIPLLKTLMPYFQTAVFVEDVKNTKPHPEPLLLAAERLSVKPEECVYVGDAETDMHAAEAAGMAMITFADDVKGNASISTMAFHELPELIEKLS
jgi:beta-phosphoglucomutase-like phosphatase (HAD superfamily)